VFFLILQQLLNDRGDNGCMETKLEGVGILPTVLSVDVDLIERVQLVF